MLSGFCGWLGTFEAGAEADAALENMAASLPCRSDDLTTRHARDPVAIAVTGEPSSASLFHDSDYVVALSGRPRWANADLETRAREQGYARVVLDLYRETGADFLKLLRGHFSCIAIDIRGRSLLLATDRMGTEPVYFAHRPGHGIVFGSSATSVRNHPDTASGIDPQAVYYYLYFHAIPSPAAVFAGQQKLLPAQCLTFENGRCRTAFYWQPRFSEDRSDLYSLSEEAKLTLRNAVKRQLSDRPTGAFLSGGVDSSTVAGMMSELGVRPVKTYSIGFDAAGYDEMDYARTTAKHFDTEQHEYYVTPQDVVSAIPTIAQTYGEPFGNSSAIPVYYCARLAREDGTRVLLAGDGGDELFGGNVRYVKQRVFSFYDAVPPWLRRFLIEPVAFHFPAGERLLPLRKARSYIEQARVPMPERLETYNFLHRTPAADVLHPAFMNKLDLHGPAQMLRETYNRPAGASMLNRMLYLDWKQTLADNDIRKVTHMSRVAGIEVRYPFLDDEVVEFSARVPSKLKIKGNRLRYFFKEALKDFLPPEVITKPKHGFGLPFGLWMQKPGPLQDIAYDSINAFKAREILNPEYLDRLLYLHQNEHAAYYGEFIWVVMMLELWLQHHPVS